LFVPTETEAAGSEAFFALLPVVAQAEPPPVAWPLPLVAPVVLGAVLPLVAELLLLFGELLAEPAAAPVVELVAAAVGGEPLVDAGQPLAADAVVAAVAAPLAPVPADHGEPRHV
jgi:hypothetical protein